MKNIEKYILVILIFIAVGAIGVAVYFGISADKDSSKIDENKQEDLLDTNRDDNNDSSNDKTNEIEHDAEDDDNKEQNMYSEISNEEVRNIFIRLKSIFAYDINNRVNMYNDFSKLSQEEINLNLLLNLAYEENFENMKTTQDSTILNDNVYDYFCENSESYGICENNELNLKDYSDIYILSVSKLNELAKEIIGRELKKEELHSVEYYRYFDYHAEDNLFYIVQPGGGGGDVFDESLKVVESKNQIIVNYVVSSIPDFHDEAWEKEFKFSFIKSTNGNWYFEKLEVVKVS